MMRFLLAALLSIATAASVHAGNIRLLAPSSMKPLLLDLLPDFERQSGHKVILDIDSAGGVLRRLQTGQGFDVIVQTIEALEKVIGEKRIDDASITPLVRVGIGAAVRLDAGHPNVTNLESLRRVLLAAKAVAYVDSSAGGGYFPQLFQRLGVLSEVRQKSVIVPGGLAAQRIASGDADFALQQYNEILIVPGVKPVGLIGEAIQKYTTYAGAVGAAARDSDAAAALLSALSDPGIEPLLKRRGLEMP
jgi:molybdate transport system substrate-binding protein